MRLEIDWQVLNDDNEWETVSTPGQRRGRRIPWRAWGAVLLALFTVALGVHIVVLHRYQGALRRIAFQVQSVIDLEARALAQGKVDLFLAQQDQATPAWYRSQRQRAYLAVASAQVQEVELNGDIAWVEVLAQGGLIRQARFYRQTQWGWVHTAPVSAFWGDEVTTKRGGVTLHYHERDRPQVKPLVDRILAAVGDVQGQLGCPPGLTLEVAWVAEDEPPHVLGHTLILPSPWLSGVPADGQWDQEALDKLAYWAAYGTACQCMRAAGDGRLNGLRRAIAAEYAAFYAHEDLAWAPILGRVVERHGAAALPDVVLLMTK